MCALSRLRVIPFKDMLYLWLRLFIVLFGRSWNLGTCFTHFILLLFIRRRRSYTYKLKKLARRQHIKEKTPVHYTSRLLRCC